MITSLRLKNFLSYGPEGETVPLGALNVLIGPNGSGKSNLIEGIALLQSAPSRLDTPIREGGGVRDWLWKGTKEIPTATIEALVELFPGTEGKLPLRYRLDFTASGGRFEITDERIESTAPCSGHDGPFFYYRYEEGHPVLSVRDPEDEKRWWRTLRREDVDPSRSILAQRQDPDIYPEITRLGEVFGRMRIYRDWSLGRYTPPRLPQPADLPNGWLEENGRNLGLVLNRLRRDSGAKIRLLEMFRAVYAEAEDFDVMVEGGTVQVFVQEGRFSVHATRLSDGTLRYLCLLAVLCDPTPPPLVCIDEPEIGLHPDLINHVADALRLAAERTQIVVTTHSTGLVDAFTNTPEVVLVCEKENFHTSVHRLDEGALRPWLQQYGLGHLWTSGEIGGNRW